MRVYVISVLCILNCCLIDYCIYFYVSWCSVCGRQIEHYMKRKA